MFVKVNINMHITMDEILNNAAAATQIRIDNCMYSEYMIGIAKLNGSSVTFQRPFSAGHPHSNSKLQLHLA